MALSDTPEISKRVAYHERGCVLGRWAQTLPEADRKILSAWFVDPNASHAAIAARINADPDYDVTFKAFAVGRHRRRECRCGTL